MEVGLERFELGVLGTLVELESRVVGRDCVDKGVVGLAHLSEVQSLDGWRFEFHI